MPYLYWGLRISSKPSRCGHSDRRSRLDRSSATALPCPAPKSKWPRPYSRAPRSGHEGAGLPMPAKKPTPEAMPSKELVLAAIERAERHRIKLDDPSRYKGG